MIFCTQAGTYLLSATGDTYTACRQHMGLMAESIIERAGEVTIAGTVLMLVDSPAFTCDWVHDETEAGLPHRHHQALGVCWCGRQHPLTEAIGLNGWGSGGMAL